MAAAACILTASSQAAGSRWQSTDFAQVRLISAVGAVGDAATVTLGLHIRLEPGWHTYWRSAGVGGIPPHFSWAGSQNLRTARIDWPVPRRFSLYGNESYGYQDEVVLPITVLLERAGEPLSVRLDLAYAVCDEMCVPVRAELTLDVPAGPAGSTPFAPLIIAHAERVPQAEALVGFAIQGITDAAGEMPGIEVSALAEPPFSSPDVFVDGAPGLAFGAPRVRLSDGARRARITLAVYSAEDAAPLAGRALTITLVDGDRFIERTVVIENHP